MTVGLLSFARPSINDGRTTINVPTGGWMNIAKRSSFNFPATATVDANGYPTVAVTALANPTLKTAFYGQYILKWTGAASMQFIGQSAIIYSGGAAVTSLVSGGGPAGTGYSAGNFTVNTTVSSPRVAFKFGALVTSVSGGSGSLVTINHVSVNFGGGFPTGTNFSFATGCSSNLVNGPNLDGSWTITKINGTSFTLNNSTGVTGPTVTGSGGVGTQTEAISEVGNVSWTYLASGTYSSPSNLVLCDSADEAAIDGGLIYDSVLVAQLLTLKGTPGGVGLAGDFWLRFMDTSIGNGSLESDFSQRRTLATQSWNSTSGPIAGYMAGAITNGGASGGFTDLYSCAGSPSNSPASGPPIDCEVIQGNVDITNAGGLPGLTVAGRSGFGNWPIINTTIEPIIFLVSVAPASAGLVLDFTFSASWLNSGVPYVKSYTTVAGDVGSIATFNVNLTAAFIADLVLRAGNIVFLNSARVVANPPAALSGVLTVTYSGAVSLVVCTLPPSTITASSRRVFIFNKLLGAFLYSTTFTQPIPCEAMVELCNRVGACLWYTWPIYTKGAFISAFTGFISDPVTGISSGLKFGTEVGNENWNFTLANWGRAQCYGIALGCFAYPYGSNNGPYSWQGLQTVNYAALSTAAWTRDPSDHRIFAMTQTVDTTMSGGWDRSCLQGRYLVTTSTNYRDYGGLGCTSAPAHDVTGSRPADAATDIGMAPYWSSKWMGGGGPSTLISGTVAQNVPLLQASMDFVQGNTSVALASMSDMVNGTTVRSSGTAGQSDFVFYATQFALQETLAAQYDAYRISVGKRILRINHYEGGFQGSMAANLNNGLNSRNCLAASIPSADITALAAAITALGWTTGQLAAYTASGLGTISEMATQILQVEQGWKYDTDVNGVAAGTNEYKDLIKVYYYGALQAAHPSREAHAGQYGYAGSAWALWWSAYNSGGSPYQSYDAISEYNA